MDVSQEIKAALAYATAGMSVVPVKLDGSKEPKGKWKDLQTRILSEPEIRQAFREPCGVGIVNGKISGNKEVLDIDNPALVAPFEETVRALTPGLLERLPTVATPRNNYGGRHYHLRIEGDVGGNTKLAESEPRLEFHPDGTPELDPKSGKQKLAPETWIETRGEGGFTIVPGGHPQCHASGLPYKHVAGPPLTEVPVISAEEHALLRRVAHSFSRNVPQHVVRGESLPATIGQAPGHAFAAATS